MFAKIKTLESQKKKRSRRLSMSVSEILEAMKKSLIVEQMNEQEGYVQSHDVYDCWFQ